MEDIRKRDRQVLLRTLFRWYKIPLYIALGWMAGLFLTAPDFVSGKGFFVAVALGGFVWAVYSGYKEHLDLRWHNRRFLELWKACVDRRKRLNEALKRLKKSKVADLQELPKSADALLDQIYLALRRADLVFHEISLSESRTSPPVLGGQGRYIADAQAQELFKVADRNIAEYSQHFKSVMAGVERSEAQAVVYATTLDTLRVRMLGYRLTSSPEAETREFLNVVTEAKMQFEAIDQALEEIELTPFPQTVTVMPPHPSKPQSNNDPERQTAEQELDGFSPRSQLADTPPPIPPEAQAKIREDNR